MQNYILQNNKIIVKNLSEFNITHILECGQVFRYTKLNNNPDYQVFSLNKSAIIKTFYNRAEIITDDVKYFVNYFDLNTNYTQIKQNLINDNQFLAPIINSAYGIRILRQNAFEMIISFIISANNNIKRIQKIIENICVKFGSNLNSFYAFPTREQLLKASVDDFKSCGAGYRAQYLYNVVRQLENFDYSYIQNNPSEKCLPKILSLQGVGPKVADCILLFGFNKSDVFPVDTWIKKVYNNYFATEKSENVHEIRKNLVNIFKDLSGFSQQYLFYYKRSLENST